MALLSNIIRTITIRGQAQGVDEAAAKARALGKATDGVAVANDRMSKSSGTTSAAVERLQRSLDAEYRSMQQLAKIEQTLNAARDQGLITLDRQNQLMTLASARYRAAGESVDKYTEKMKLAKEVTLGFITGIGAGVLIGTLTELPTAIADAVDRLGNIGNKAQTIGVTTQALQELRYAARLSDVEIGTLDEALQRFSTNLAKNGGPLQKEFEINHKVISGDVMTDLKTYADLISHATNAEQKNILVTTAFGKSAQEMGRLFDDGAAGIATWGAEADKAGAVFSDEKIERARELNDQMERLKPQIEAAQSEFALLIAPAEVAILQSFNDALRQTSELFTAINNLDLRKIASIIGRDDGSHPSLFGKNGLIQFDWDGTGAARANNPANNITVSGGNAFSGSAGSAAGSNNTPTRVFDPAGEAAAKAAASATESLRKAYASLILTTQQKIDQSLRERASIGLTSDAALKLKNEQDLLQDAQKKGIDLDAMTADGTRTKRQELLALADQLTATTIETQRLQEAQKQVDDVFKAIGDTIGEVFSGGIKSFDEFVDHMLNSLAKIGQDNIAKAFTTDGFAKLTGGGAANDNGNPLAAGLSAVGGALPVNVTNTDDISKGLGNLFKSLPAGTLPAAAGGLGVGYQSQNPLLGAAGGALAGASAGPWGAVIGGIAGLVGGILGMMEAAQKARDELKKDKDAIDTFIAAGFGETVSQYSAAILQFNQQAEEFIKLAEAAGDSALVQKLKDAQAAYVGTLGKQLQDDIDRSINSSNGKDYLNDIADAQATYTQRLKDGATLGIDVAAKAAEELTASLKKTATDAKLTTSQILVLAAQFPALASGLNALIGVVGGPSLDDLQQNVDDAKSTLRDAYEEQVSIYKQTADSARQASKTIRDFIASLDTNKSLSPLSPYDQLQSAAAQFAQVSQGALSGKADDVAKLTDVSQSYLDAAKGYYASSEQYFAVFNQVKSILDQTANTQDSVASTADMQLAALNTQVGSLISIDNGVQSVAAAIAALAAAQGALAAGQAANKNGATPMGAVDQLYQSVLGRSADASGSAYWQSRITAAGGLTPDITRAFVAAGVSNGESVDPTIRAAYGYASGTSFHPGGWAWVGEQGPELMRLPRGSQVMPAAASSSYANDNAALLAEVRRLNETVNQLLQANVAGDVENVNATRQVVSVASSTSRQQKLDGVRKAKAA